MISKENIFKAFLWLATFTASLHAIFLSVVVLLLADLITGIWASCKEKTSISSHRLWNTGNKIILYNFAILISFMVETYMLQEVPWVRIVTGFVAMTELKSFYENICRITGQDIWSYIREQMANFKKKDSVITILLLAVLSTGMLSCKPAAVSTFFSQDTTYQQAVELVPLTDLPGIDLKVGEKVKYKTAILELELQRVNDSLVAVKQTRPVIRQKESSVQAIPVKIKDKSRTVDKSEQHTNSHNSSKSKDFSKDKSNENSHNRQKEKKTDPLPLILIVLGLGIVAFIVYRIKTAGLRGLFGRISS